jgi:hypothetical protein
MPAKVTLRRPQGRYHSIGTVGSGIVFGADFLAGALYTSTPFFVVFLIDSFAASGGAIELWISLGANAMPTGGCVAQPAVAMTTINNSVTERASRIRQSDPVRINLRPDYALYG